MRKLLNGRAVPELVTYTTQFVTVDDGAIALIERWCLEHPDARTVIIDTFGKIRGMPDGRRGAYQQDYADIGALKDLADRLGILILLIHHTRKMAADDVFDLISGTTGIAGAADTLLVITRPRGSETAKLALTGRDIIHDGEFAMRFNKDTGQWEWLGEARQVEQETNSNRIACYLRDHGPVTNSDIADALNLPKTVVKSRLNDLKAKGSAISVARGTWDDPFRK